MKVELVFNLDEVSMSEWEARKEKKAIVPATMDGQAIHHRASQSVRHISISTCITAAGESLTPYIVTSQDSGGIRKRLMSHGVRLVSILYCRTDRSYRSAVSFPLNISR
jgi:hypothetical protein